MQGTSSKHRREGAFDLSTDGAALSADSIMVDDIHDSTALRNLGEPLPCEVPTEQIALTAMRPPIRAVSATEGVKVLDEKAPPKATSARTRGYVSECNTSELATLSYKRVTYHV